MDGRYNLRCVLHAGESQCRYPVPCQEQVLREVQTREPSNLSEELALYESGVSPSGSVAIIGSVGVPNRYGGPEAFAESISPELAKAGYHVTVTCDRRRYLDDLSPWFRGTRRRFIRMGANGVTSPLHDMMAFLAVFWRADYVLALGVSGGLFFPLFRVLCMLSGTRLLVNIDGVEWRRSKFGGFGKLVLFLSDWLAQRFSHVVIYDNDALLPFVNHPWKSICVEYSGDQALAVEAPATESRCGGEYALTVCRIEPENNCELLLQGFLQSSGSCYVFVGNWERSPYGRDLRARYAGEPRLKLLDPIYDPRELFVLRNGCTHYLHGHSVGGTNPSLVEILFFDCQIYCFDCGFNRATAGDSVRYFHDPADLATKLNEPDGSVAQRAMVRDRYTREAISRKLRQAFAIGIATS
jgi:glycosyltransferase involved in cell wall biosynthesis